LIGWTAAALLLLAWNGAAPAAPAPTEFAQVTVRQQIIVRVPVRARRPVPRVREVEWKEAEKGPKCVKAKNIAGAALLGQDSVDLILRDNSRVRAKLESSCPALDYYYGFYITPGEDGRVCADRDLIRSRVGGKCEIEKFRNLWAQPRE
jgi:hypothetical protein